MAELIGRLAVNLTMETAAFQKGAGLAEKRAATMSKRLGDLGGKIAGIGKNISLGLTAPLAAFAATGIKQAQEQAAAMAQVNAAIASMGPVAGRTSEQLAKMADSLEGKSLFDADVILTKVTANLLTFGNVAKEQFDRAQQAAIDMATRMGSDPQSAAIMLGKALNDPIKGISALTRVGVQFTAQQKEQIKTLTESGEISKAQGVILAEVERQFAGAAAAAANADPMRKVTVEFNKAAEAIGTAILPLLPVLTDAIVKVLSAFTSLSPGVQSFVIIAGGLAAALGPIILAIGGIVSGIGFAMPAIAAIGAAFTAFKVVLLTGILPALGSLLVALAPILIPLAAITAAVYAGYMVWKNWDKIKPILVNLYNGVKTYLMDKLSAVFDFVRKKIEAVKKYFYNLYDAVVGNSYIPDMVDGIRDQMRRLDAVMVAPAAAATSKTAQAFADLEAKARTILDRLFPEIREALNYQADRNTLVEYFDKAKLSAEQLAVAMRAIRDEQFGGLQTVTTDTDSQLDANASDDVANIVDSIDMVQPKVQALGASIKQSFSDLGAFASRAFDVVGNNLQDAILGAQSFGDAIKNVVAQLADMALSIAFSALKTSLGIPGFASGTRSAPRGMALVGERGPELVNLHGGERIYNNKETMGMLGGRSGSNVALNINVNGPMDAGMLRETKLQLANQLRRTLNNR